MLAFVRVEWCMYLLTFVIATLVCRQCHGRETYRKLPEGGHRGGGRHSLARSIASFRPGAEVRSGEPRYPRRYRSTGRWQEPPRPPDGSACVPV